MKVNIRSNNGVTVALEVQESDTIADISKKIKGTGVGFINETQQKPIFESANKTLFEVGVKDGDTLIMNVSLPDDLPGVPEKRQRYLMKMLNNPGNLGEYGTMLLENDVIKLCKFDTTECSEVADANNGISDYLVVEDDPPEYALEKYCLKKSYGD